MPRKKPVVEIELMEVRRELAAAEQAKGKTTETGKRLNIQEKD